MDGSINAWIGKAKKDIGTAELLLKNSRFEDSAFFSQQAAEKSLKAVLLKRTKKIRKIHDLVELGRDVNLPEELLEGAKKLTMAYIYSRYPDVKREREMDDIAGDLLEIARGILEWAETKL